jgi:predicted DNA-binding transcriptional regulator AlpA
VVIAASSGLGLLIWVTSEKAAELTGFSRQAIYARIKRRGFYPVNADTSKKAKIGQKECHVQAKKVQ